MDHASRKLAAADEEIPPLPFEEAVSFMKSKIPMPKKEWNALEPKLRFRAFTVARLTQLDYIEAARGRLISAMEKGEGYASTWKDIKAIAAEDGALNFRPGYWENVYRTNTQTAYTAGKLMQFKDNPPPAWRLLIVDDDRTSDICRGLMRDGKQSLTMVSDHPFWETFGYPPYHFNCRTGLQAVYQSEIGNETTVENPSMKSLRKEFTPMDGFGGNPLDKESWWKITDSMIERATKYGIWSDILQQTADLDMISYQKELLKGYVHLFDGQKGGYVQQSKNWNYSKKELDTAKELANDGHKIYLLPRSKIVKSADMIIDNKIGEIKHQEEPGFKSISSEIRDAGKFQRARVVVINALEETTSDDIQKGLWKEIHRTPVQTVILKWHGKTWNLPRDLLMNKNWVLPKK